MSRVWVLFALLVLCSFATLYYRHSFGQIPFDSVAWKAEARKNSMLRARMMDDVMRMLKAGAIPTRESTFEQFGPPDDAQRGDDPVTVPSYKYFISTPGLIRWPRYLWLQFDEKGKISHFGYHAS